MNSKKLTLSALAAIAAVGSHNAPALSAEATLRGASCFPIGSPPSRPFEAVVKEINKRGKGVVQVKLAGGAPAIGSPFTLTQKMSRGAFDIVGCTEAYFGNVLPEAPVLRFSEYSFAELRRRGGIAYVNRLMRAKNIHYVGRHHDDGPFHLYLSKPIAGPDLKGLHLRVSPVYTAFFTSLGATVQRSNIAQIYTYMENGTVQGFGWPARSWLPSWLKVTKYRVDPGFYNAALHTLVNLRRWNSLSTPQRNVITQVVRDFEARSEPDGADYNGALKKAHAWMAKKGLKTITFTGDARKLWQDKAREAGWAEVIKRSPEHGPKLKELFTRN